MVLALTQLLFVVSTASIILLLLLVLVLVVLVPVLVLGGALSIHANKYVNARTPRDT